MKIKTYVRKNGEWVQEIQDMNPFLHYWYSIQIIIPYYWEKLKSILGKDE